MTGGIKHRTYLILWFNLDCIDKHPACPGWVSLCQTHPDVKKLCPKTCGDCKYNDLHLDPAVRRVDNFIQRIKLVRSKF